MPCESEWQRYQAAEGPERDEARDEFFACILRNLAIQAGRASHASAWDERMYHHYKFLQEAWDALFGGIKPLPGPEDPRTRTLRAQLSAKPERMLWLSKAVAQALERAEIKLGDKETFACLLFVIDKPEYASELITQPAIGAERKSPQVQLVVEPGTMRQVMEALQRDRLE